MFGNGHSALHADPDSLFGGIGLANQACEKRHDCFDGKIVTEVYALP